MGLKAHPSLNNVLPQKCRAKHAEQGREDRKSLRPETSKLDAQFAPILQQFLHWKHGSDKVDTLPEAGRPAREQLRFQRCLIEQSLVAESANFASRRACEDVGAHLWIKYRSEELC
jgi:hypothetical protein